MYIIAKIDYRAYIAKNSKPGYENRLENIDELENAAEQFVKDVDEEDPVVILNNFLSNAVLESGVDQSASDTDYVQLMTLHSTKGLEFETVFLCGLEEGLFPHIMSMGEVGGVEEERRLCYVGMTRAKKKLYLLHADTRYLHGVTHIRRPSRFLNEIPEELLEEDGFVTVSKETNSDEVYSDIDDSGDDGFYLGQNVRHPVFGVGVITNMDGQGEFHRMQVHFKRVGSKWLSSLYAKLEKI